MAKLTYKKNRRKPKVRTLISYVLFALISIWLLASIYLGVSPIDIIKKGFVSIGSVGGGDTIESLKAEITEKDSIIQSLTEQKNSAKNYAYTKAIVKVSSNTLNMRDQASLSSDIILQIPTESEVNILFYDTETYYLQGKPGKWCKISYAGVEGWVWGNFLLEIE